MRAIAVHDDFNLWRFHARRLLAAQVEPDQVLWQSFSHPTLFDVANGVHERSVQRRRDQAATPLVVPRRFLEFGRVVASYRDSRRWTLLYELLWRLCHGEHELLNDLDDPVVRECKRMERAVRVECRHTLRTLRFSNVQWAGETLALAWHSPHHVVLPLIVPSLCARFGRRQFAILTPTQSVYWDGLRVHYGDGFSEGAKVNSDEIVSAWRARFEAAAGLHDGESRNGVSMAAGSNGGPSGRSAALATARAAAATCRACPLYKSGTQTVFGMGDPNARLMLIGEQPGDVEDQQGIPFVGPAGRLLEGALEELGIRRESVYLTNAVKHFKWEPRGNRRVHKKPSVAEMKACHPWLERELALVSPEVVICLGSTAARAVLGRTVKISEARGGPHASTLAPAVFVTMHPSAILRIPDEAQRDAQYRALLKDLRAAIRHLGEGAPEQAQVV